MDDRDPSISVRPRSWPTDDAIGSAVRVLRRPQSEAEESRSKILVDSEDDVSVDAMGDQLGKQATKRGRERRRRRPRRSFSDRVMIWLCRITFLDLAATAGFVGALAVMKINMLLR